MLPCAPCACQSWHPILQPCARRRRPLAEPVVRLHSEGQKGVLLCIAMQAELALLVSSSKCGGLAGVARSELAANVVVRDDDVQEEESAVGSCDNNVRVDQACHLCLSGEDSEAAAAGLAVGRQSRAGSNMAHGSSQEVVAIRCLLLTLIAYHCMIRTGRDAATTSLRRCHEVQWDARTQLVPGSVAEVTGF
jgi:hypothetical protein